MAAATGFCPASALYHVLFGEGGVLGPLVWAEHYVTQGGARKKSPRMMPERMGTHWQVSWELTEAGRRKRYAEEERRVGMSKFEQSIQI
jgi:hypothetical protein